MIFEIIYSKRKTLSLQVKPDLSVVVHAPKGLSKKYIDSFVKDKEGWILNQIEKIKAMPFNPYTATDKEIEAMKEKTLSLVVPRVEHYAKIMGLSPKKISVSSAKRRFASCSSQGTLNFSFRLCNYPQEAIDYVVVHELAHMVEMNHSKRFWAVVARYMPDYQERRKLLK